MACCSTEVAIFPKIIIIVVVVVVNDRNSVSMNI